MGTDPGLGSVAEFEGTALVEIDGKPTKKTGSNRDFVTPDLDNGKRYAYAVRVSYSENGEKKDSAEKIKTIPVRIAPSVNSRL